MKTKKGLLDKSGKSNYCRGVLGFIFNFGLGQKKKFQPKAKMDWISDCKNENYRGLDTGCVSVS